MLFVDLHCVFMNVLGFSIHLKTTKSLNTNHDSTDGSDS